MVAPQRVWVYHAVSCCAVLLPVVGSLVFPQHFEQVLSEDRWDVVVTNKVGARTGKRLGELKGGGGVGEMAVIGYEQGTYAGVLGEGGGLFMPALMHNWQQY